MNVPTCNFSCPQRSQVALVFLLLLVKYWILNCRRWIGNFQVLLPKSKEYMVLNFSILISIQSTWAQEKLCEHPINVWMSFIFFPLDYLSHIRSLTSESFTKVKRSLARELCECNYHTCGKRLRGWEIFKTCDISIQETSKS